MTQPSKKWPSEREPLLYQISRLVIGTAMRGYFSGIEIVGQQHVPERGPVIFASNHPHSITDAFVLGHGTGRMLNFLAHSGLFSNGFKSWFLRNSGVIPIYRTKDVSGAADANLTMFSACHEILGQGGAIGIFPEGTSAEDRRVQKLKTGTARIALGAEAEAHWDLGVQVLPVGLNFESVNRFRSRVLIRFGPPIPTAEYRTQYEVDPVAAANKMTEDLQRALKREVVNVEQSASEQFVRDVENIYRAELMCRTNVNIPGATDFQRAQTISREFARALDYFQTTNPEVLWGLSRRLRRYNAMCKTLKLKDNMLRAEQGPGMRKELGRFVGMGLAGLPWALLGLLGNYIPYRLTAILTKRIAPDRTKIHFTQGLLGLLFFLPWYVAIIKIMLGSLGTMGTTVLLLCLPPAGLFARGYFRYLSRRRQMMRLAWLELVHGLRISDMRRQRRVLINEMDLAMDEYMNWLEIDNPRGDS